MPFRLTSFCLLSNSIFLVKVFANFSQGFAFPEQKVGKKVERNFDQRKLR